MAIISVPGSDQGGTKMIARCQSHVDDGDEVDRGVLSVRPGFGLSQVSAIDSHPDSQDSNKGHCLRTPAFGAKRAVAPRTTAPSVGVPLGLAVTRS